MNPVDICHFLWDIWNSPESGRGDTLPTATGKLRYASFVIYVITCFLGLVGNSIVILVISCKMKKMKAMTWLLNLAVADLVFLACLPLRAISLFLEQWDFGWLLCKLYHFLSNLNMYVSIFILTALSIDRCLSVALPLWHRKCVSKHYIRWVCLMVWIITTAISIPGFLYSEEVNIDNKTQCTLGFHKSKEFNVTNLFVNSADAACLDKHSNLVPFTNIEGSITELWDKINSLFPPGQFEAIPLHRESCQKDKVQQFYNRCINKDELAKWHMLLVSSEPFLIPLLTFGFLIPLVIITFTNIIIAIQARRSPQKMSSKLYKLVVAMVATYFVAWTPLASVETVFLIAARRMNFHLMHRMITVLPLVSSIACFHSCLNPILYVLLSKRVKRSLSESWSGLWKSVGSRSDKSSSRHPSKSEL